MQEMTGIERMLNILKRQPVDRIGLYEHFWNDTHREWVAQGHLREDEHYDEHFNFDLTGAGWPNLTADLDFEPIVLEETEETILTKNGNGATLRNHKLHASTPEHVDFDVKDRDGWEERIKPLLLKYDKRRINYEQYRKERARAHKNNRLFTWQGVNVFECMHPVCGHEYMLMGMALDPDWITDMVNVYSDLLIALQEDLFAAEGKPDAMFYYEDMGFKQKPFMSPAMYDELIKPGHVKTINYAKSQGLPVIMHSCGYVAPLLPGMIDAGIDCYNAIEVKAGMDLVQLYKDYGEVLSFMGGLDVRAVCSNDRAQIDAELEAKVPIVKGNYGMVLHSDHSIPNTVHYDTYRYFIDKGLELGQYA